MAKEKLILIVEDDQEIRRTMTEVIEGIGHRVSCACDGEDALRVLSSTEDLPDLIFLDIMMPNLTGAGFLEKKSKDSRLKDVPVVVISASKTELQSPCIVGHLQKPFSIEKLFVFLT